MSYLVKAKVSGNWHTGSLIQNRRESSQVCQVEIGTKVYEVEPNLVKRFVPLPSDHIPTSETLHSIYERTARALSTLLPEYVNQLSVSTVSHNISVANNLVNIEPCICEVETIGSFIEKQGWQVTVIETIPTNNIFEPEWHDMKEVGKFLHDGDAIICFIKTLFNIKVDCFFCAENLIFQ